ncbi:uncharacterized protein C8Q71DRAFT_841066, partial [Rhodofomes roseus]
MPSLKSVAVPGASHSLSCSSCLDRLPPVPYSDDTVPDIVMSDKDSVRIQKSDAQPLVAYHAQQKSDVNEDRWKSEIFRKIIEIEDPLDAFLQEFVPSSKPVPPLAKRRGGYFRIPKDVTEPGMYEPIRKGLDKLVASFPTQKQPKFFNYGHKALPFPFDALRADFHATKPDVVATVPTIPADTTALKWRNVAFVIEVKRADDDDPMLKVTERRNSTLVQLAKSARNIMLAQGRLFVLLVGIYGSKARIYRFDRAGAVVSQAFQYAREPAILYEFLWRLVHPHHVACRVVGGDPTIRLANKKEQQKAQNWVHKLDPTYSFTHEDRKACRFITVNDGGNDKTSSRKYLVYRLLFVNPRLFTRGTAVWEAMELSGPGNKNTGKRVVIKEYWRQLVRIPESDFYEEMIEANMEFMGIADYKYGEDLGAPEARDIHRPATFPVSSEEAGVSRDTTGATQENATSHVTEEHGVLAGEGGIRRSTSSEPDAEGSDAAVDDAIPGESIHYNPLSSPLTSLSSLSARSDSARRDSDAQGPARSPSSDSLPVLTPSPPPEEAEESTPLGHRTVSGWYHAGQKHQFYERSHMRLVLETIGIPLRQFKNTLELVIALCDAIEGHKRAYDAGVIHKDVSEGNVMIVRRETGPGGFLQDFDYAFSWKKFLRRRGWHATKESWKVYVRTGQGIVDPAICAEDAQAVEERKRRHDCKERTGTVHFMAVDVVTGGITQDVRHDLESFYWLLVWMLLRYAEHEHRNGIQACQKLFGGSSDDTCGGQKMWWLVQRNVLTIKNNAPLNHLLERFRLLCRSNISNLTLSENPMSHDEVLRIFHEAIDMEGWPNDDAARDYQRPQNDKDQEQLDALGQLREKSSIEPSSKAPSLEALNFTVHTGSEMVVPEDLDEDEDDRHPDDRPVPGRRLNSILQSRTPQRTDSAGRQGHVSFGGALLSSAPDRPMADSSDGRLPGSRRRGNTSRDAASNPVTSTRRPLDQPARSTQDPSTNASLPGPSRGVGWRKANAPVVRRAASRTMPPPPLPSASLARTRSQTLAEQKSLNDGASSSQGISRAAKRVYSAENDEQNQSQTSKRPKRNSRASRPSSPESRVPYAS